MIVTLLTDYGHEDEFAGVLHGVVLSIAPEARIVDLTHGIPRYGVLQGALVLRNSLPYLPVGVHVAVVDPQVGTERRALAVVCGDGRVLVGPDNGVLSLAWEAAGGARLAVDVTRSPHRLEPVSATFHGRDVFAPVAAHIAAGADPADAGDPMDPVELERIELPRSRMEDDALVTQAVTVDRYGNASLGLGHAELPGTGLTLGAPVELELGDERYRAQYTSTFADVAAGELIVYEDANRHLAIAINRGHAADTLGLRAGSEVRLRPAR